MYKRPKLSSPIAGSQQNTDIINQEFNSVSIFAGNTEAYAIRNNERVKSNLSGEKDHMW